MTSILDACINHITNTKGFRVWKGFDRDILRNLTAEGIETRPSSSNGLWCCMLLPIILGLYSIQYRVSLLYATMACISVGCLCYSLLFIIFMSVSCLVLKENIYGGIGASSTVSAMLMYAFLGHGLIFSVAYSLLAISMYSSLLRISLTMFPKTFTIGEAMIVVQAITLFILMIFTRMSFGFGDISDTEMEFVYHINFTILSSVGIIVTALILLDENTRTLSYISGIVGTYALVMLHLLIGINAMIYIASYVLLNVRRLQLFLFWVILSAAAVAALSMRTRLKVKATTVTRKVFHVLASLVFLSGIIIDMHFMTLAAGAGLGLVILMEALRKSDIKIITPALQSAFKIFSDEKDAGHFAMTPIYLYVGLACPLVLVPAHEGYELELISGILSLGIGDTAASWFGFKYGTKFWSGSKKSFEGTLFNVLSQIMTVYLLQLFGFLNVQMAMVKILLAAIITGWVEAKTHQIDNLVLPLFSIISFQLASFVLIPLSI